MKASKWYLVQGQSESGNYAIIKEEDTDLIVAQFPATNRHESNVRLLSLQSVIEEHNKLVKLIR